MMTYDALFEDDCKRRAIRRMASYEEFAKRIGKSLEDITELDLESLTALVKEVRLRYPPGSKITFDDSVGETTDGTATTATGVIEGNCPISPIGIVLLWVVCERAGMEEITVLICESRVIQVTKP